MIDVAFKGDETIIKSDQHVYQWDTGQKIMVSGLGDSNINQVHFSFNGLKTAYPVNVTNSSGTVTVNTPNIVLRYGKDVYMYLCIKNTNGTVVTIKTVIIPVIKRNMPENYMYDDDETVAVKLDELQTEIQRSTAVDTDHETRLVSLEEAKTNASGTTFNTLKERIDTADATSEQIKEDLTQNIGVTGYGYYTKGGTVANDTDNHAFVNSVIDVRQGERYKIEASVYANQCLYNMFDEAGACLYSHERVNYSNLTEENFNIVIEIPKNVVKIIISGLSSKGGETRTYIVRKTSFADTINYIEKQCEIPVISWTDDAFIDDTGNIATYNESCYATLDVSEFVGLELEYTVYTQVYTSLAFYNADGYLIKSFSKKYQDAWEEKTEFVKAPENATVLKLSTKKTQKSNFNVRLKNSVIKLLSNVVSGQRVRKYSPTDNGLITDSTITAPYDDLNTLPSNIYVTYSMSDTIPTNTPRKTGKHFIVYSYSNYLSDTLDTGIIQILTYYNGMSYIRMKWGTLWDSWKVITNVDDSNDGVNYKYCDVLPYKFNITSSSTLIFSGDSITAGRTSKQGESEYTSNGYVGEIRDALGCTIKNFAVPASSFVRSEEFENSTIIGALTAHVSELTGDYLFVAGGTNDHGFGTDPTAFVQAVNSTFDYIDSHFTGKVIVILPINKAYTPTREVKSLDWYRQTLFEIAIEI